MANSLALDDTSILTISSRKKISNPFEKLDKIDNEFDYIEHNVDDIPLHIINIVSSHVAEYVAGFVERRILQLIKCNTCCELLNECNEVQSSFIQRKSFGFLKYSRTDTLTVVTAAEKIFNLFRIQDKLKSKNILQNMIILTIRHINLSQIFINFDSHIKDMDVMENHKYLLVKLILKIFFNIKLHYFSKQNTINEHKAFLRHKLTKTILFSGQ